MSVTKVKQRVSPADGLDERTRDALAQYLRDVRSLPNESAKTHRFAGLISDLFPGTPAPTKFAAGVEKVVRIELPTRKKVGSIDAYFGNVIIEFERSLRTTEEEAKRQLREYALGVWTTEGTAPRPLVCVASDGVQWKTFRPRVREGASGKLTPDDIELDPLRTLTVSEGSLREFWVWLTSLLFGGSGQRPSAERFRGDFGATSPAFAHALDALERAWLAVRERPEPQLKFQTWQRYLAVTYGQIGDAERQEELEHLFLTHTYLASTARFLVWGALSRGRAAGVLRDVARDVLSGGFFEGQGIENLVEDDFFQWVHRKEAERILAPVWERILAQILTYALEDLDQDVLKGVYQELVDRETRHELGEYYTPEWLCERIVNEVLPKRGFVRLIDPTCGSGSFLRAAIAHMLKANPNGNGHLRQILDCVVGIDIHPLAVIISKTTYLLAISSLVKAAKRPIQIPVYLADSLFLPTEVKQLRLGEAPGYEIRFGGDRSVSIPEDLVRTPELFDPAIAACAKVAADLAASGKETEASLRAYLRRSVQGLGDRPDFGVAVGALWKFTQQMADLIRHQRNSIWAFIIRNSYRPAMLRGRFDVVLGNPPWLSYRFISDPEYQEEVKRRAVVEYKVAPRTQRLITQMELATVFLVHTLSTFGRPGARLGFVMPRSVLSADQHAKFRDGSHAAPVRVDGYWDLKEVSEVFKVPSCVVFATHVDPKLGHARTTYEKMPTVEFEGKLLARDAPWTEARRYLSETKRTAKLVSMGGRTAYSTTAKSTPASAASPYAKLFRQGATIVPRSFYFVRVKDLNGEVDPERVYWAETDPEQAATAKKPYNDVRLSGHVEGRFMFTSALSKHLLPFALVDPPLVLLPIEGDGDGIRVLTATELRESGYREVAKWMTAAERIWADKRRGKAERQSVYQRLDYSRELSHQSLRARFLALYNASGTNLSAAAVDCGALRERFVVDAKLYWTVCRSQDEADYLAAILNAPALDKAIKPFQSMGLIGERDIHKKALEAPIPHFDPNKPGHAKLAKLGAEARAEANRVVNHGDLPRSLARRRALIRTAISVTLEQIDAAVLALLGL